MLFGYGQVGNKKYTAGIDRLCASIMKSLIAEPKQNIDKNTARNIFLGEKKKGKVGEKIKKIKESCRWTSLKLYLNF